MGPCIAVSMQCSEDGASFVAPAAYLRFLQNAGARTVMVGPVTSLESFKLLMAGCQGFLVPGGNDIEPHRYGRVPLHELDEPVPLRDEFEIEAVRWAVSSGIPFLGICRGAQVLNVAFGGSLRQRLARPDYHWPGNDFERAAHGLILEEGSLLSQILGEASVEVNSLHHQAVDALGSGILVEAKAPDGVIEAIRAEGNPFALGVQWHPEGMPRSKASQDLAAAFVRACMGCALPAC